MDDLQACEIQCSLPIYTIRAMSEKLINFIKNLQITVLLLADDHAMDLIKEMHGLLVYNLRLLSIVMSKSFGKHLKCNLRI